MAKPTFKNDSRPTGLASVGFVAGCDIKRTKKVIGRIHAPSRFGGPSMGYEVWFMINKSAHENCTWSWITYSKNHKTLEDAKQSVRDSWADINQIDLREMEE
jgi:hypothetical protein